MAIHICLDPDHPQHIFCKLYYMAIYIVYFHIIHNTSIANFLYDSRHVFTSISSITHLLQTLSCQCTCVYIHIIHTHLLQTFYLAIHICLNTYQLKFIYCKLFYMAIHICKAIHICLHPYHPQYIFYKLFMWQYTLFTSISSTTHLLQTFYKTIHICSQ